MAKRWPLNVLVLGASGIVGQHLRLTQPDEVEAVYARRQPGPYFVSCDLDDYDHIFGFLSRLDPKPDVIINLAGENRTDVVEDHPGKATFINVGVPLTLAAWCENHDARLFQVSTQGVFSGELPPYRANRLHDESPVNAYGVQKLRAEQALAEFASVSIVRLTFVLGVRWSDRLGRPNPMELWLSEGPLREVMDRRFSPSAAMDVARQFWRLVLARRGEAGVYHIGRTLTVTRFALASTVRHLQAKELPMPVMHADFVGIAERPRDTSFGSDTLYAGQFVDQLEAMATQWRERMDYMSVRDRASELSLFFHRDVDMMAAQLSAGFHHFHQQVAESFRNAKPDDDAALLEWYRATTAYIWELSAYHLDPGFNYMGMCDGIRTHLARELPKTTKSDDGLLHVLCLGDGIGDLSLFLNDALSLFLNDAPEFCGYYHDLAGSKTAEFAALRYWRRYGTTYEHRFVLSVNWTPPVPPVSMDAVVALDFFEHLPNVEEWTAAVFAMLRSGGLFLAQNAFGIGDLEHEGSIPMHLTRNNRYVTEWEPLLERTGFVRSVGGWWSKP